MLTEFNTEKIIKGQVTYTPLFLSVTSFILNEQLYCGKALNTHPCVILQDKRRDVNLLR